jgi:hypothetical protein
MRYYVIVDSKTRTKITYRPTGRDSYATEAAARAAVTRMRMQGLEVMDDASYRAQVPTRRVRNLMTDKEVEIAADTPLCCDPSLETYWSM